MTNNMQSSDNTVPVEVAHAEELIRCPYCGESIRPNAKKCRYCGEWLAEGFVNELPANGPVAQNNPYPVQPMPQPIQPMQPIAPQPVVMPNTAVAPGSAAVGTANQNNVVVNVQNIVEQKQEQTVVVQHSGGSAPDWIFGEIWLIAAGIGWALESWLWFFGLGIGLSGLLFIPFLGAVLCWVLGAAWGILAGAICYSIWGTTAGWIGGIIATIIVSLIHMEARQESIDE